MGYLRLVMVLVGAMAFIALVVNPMIVFLKPEKTRIRGVLPVCVKVALPHFLPVARLPIFLLT